MAIKPGIVTIIRWTHSVWHWQNGGVLRSRVLIAAAVVALGCTLSPVQAASFPVSELAQDARLNAALVRLVSGMRLRDMVESRRFAVSLVDVTDPLHPRYAGVNDHVMMYAASLPKIAVLVAGFEQIRAGMISYTPEVRSMFERIARRSSNVDASRAIQMVGFENIARILTSPKYRLYDPDLNGGLWLGKAYGGPNDSWKRDPLHNISHGATAYQTARFFVLMAQHKLVDAKFSDEIKDIMGQPEINHKFVKGLSGMSDVAIYRKSGTWDRWHADAALIEHAGRKYVAVGLVEDRRGGEILEKLIRGLDGIICSDPVVARGPSGKTLDEPLDQAGDGHMLTR